MSRLLLTALVVATPTAALRSIVLDQGASQSATAVRIGPVP